MRLPDPQRSHALLIGSAAYRSPELPDLPAVRNNLAALAGVLTEPRLGGLPVDRCAVLPDPTGVQPTYRFLRRSASATEDMLLIYFAGR
jgi:hypothetical protein